MSWRALAERTAQWLQIGVTDQDSPHARRVKTMLAATLILGAVYSVLLMLGPNRTAVELFLDGFGLVICLIALWLQRTTGSVQRAFTFIFWTVLVLLVAYYFVHGTRDGDLYFAMLLPVASVAFFGPRRSVKHLVSTLAVVVVAMLIAPVLPRIAHDLNSTAANPEGWVFQTPDRTLFSPLEGATFLGVTIVIYALSHAGASALNAANARVENLLLSILPSPIAKRLMASGDTGAVRSIVDRYDNVSVLFADIVGFTVLSRRMSPDELVNLLNRLFSEFDRITAAHDVEKIKTIGDAYMAVCGLPQKDPLHCEKIADTALALLEVVDRLNGEIGQDLNLRIGIASGPVVAGVIGRRKFAYDLWGETVNTASRMESYGRPGTIQASRSAHELLRDSFKLQALGDVQIKGYGLLPVWQLLGRK